MFPKRARTGQLLTIALPMVGGMLSQNLLDVVDALMVAQLGTAALAAVGIASFANFLTVAALIGLGAGVQTIVARRMGEGRHEDAAIPVNGGLTAALLAGIPIAALGVWFAPTIFPYLVDFDPEVIREGVPYWQARLVGGIAIGLNFSFRGYWFGIGETKTSMKVILAMHVINVVVSYCLIFGRFGFPELGTLGAGIGTTFSLFCGTMIYFAVTYRRAREHGFLRRLPRGKTFTSLVNLSVPSAIQTLLMAGGFTTLFVIAAQVGEEALAISNVVLNLIKIAALPTMAFGFATMTLVSGAMGRKDPDDANDWAWDSAKITGCVICVICVTLFLGADWITGRFLDDPSLVALAALVLRIQCMAMGTDVVATILAQGLSGAGAAKRVMIVNMTCQWGVGLPLAFLLGIGLDVGVMGVWMGQVANRVLAAIIFVGLWRRGAWRTIEV